MPDSDRKNEAGSPPRKGRNSHSEQTDEAPGLIEGSRSRSSGKFPQMTISRSSVSSRASGPNRRCSRIEDLG